MKYKLIEDKNGTIVLGNGKRYSMSKLEYTKDDLIDIQNDYDILYKKLYAQDKIINNQALEIARLKETLKGTTHCFDEVEHRELQQAKDKLQNDYQEARDRIDELEQEIARLKEQRYNLKEDFKRHIDRINELTERIDKAIEYIKNNVDNTGWLEIGSNCVKELLEILGDKENV